TAAYFSNDTGAALTSRTIRQISQTTITQREVQSNPNATETNPRKKGPGYVAPIGLGGHFPADIAHTPPVDLFAIEHTNRAVLTGKGPDGKLGPTILPGPDGRMGTDDDLFIDDDVAYNVTPAPGKYIPIPYAYAQQTGIDTDPKASNNRGIA